MTNFKYGFKKSMDLIIKLLFPPRCIYCNTLISLDLPLEICKDCEAALPLIDIGKACKVCGQPKDKGNSSVLCIDCKNTKHYFVKNFSPFEYVDIVKDAILRFKFMDKKRYADTFAKLMVKVIKEQNYTSEFDSIVYTPMSKSSMRQRGYNQAKLLAKVVAKELDCEFINNALFKIKETLPQRELTRYKRQQNLKNAFEINQNVNIKGKTILIVDDIYTTGATIDECAKVLIKNGAKKVYSATIAVGKGFY